MIDPSTVVLGGITVAVVSGAVVRILGNNRVKEDHCGERRLACTLLLGTKIDNLANDIREIKDVVKKTV